ncbi:hypothetical protein FQZ97_926710 [compost metagenome]
MGQLRQRRDGAYRLGHQARGAFGALGRPVLVALEVVIRGSGLRLQEARQVGHPDIQLAQALKGRAVVFPRLGLVEAGAVGRLQLVAMQQSATGRVDHQQLGAVVLQGIAQALELLVAVVVQAELAPQVLGTAEQPAVTGLDQATQARQARQARIEAGRRRAQAAAGLGPVGRGRGAQVAGGRQQCGRDQVGSSVHRLTPCSPGCRRARSAPPAAGAAECP